MKNTQIKTDLRKSSLTTGLAEVRKPISFLNLWQSQLTLPEFKILDLYISRINIHDPETRCVTIKKSEFEEILGTRVNRDVLRFRLEHLLHNVVSIPYIDKNGYETCEMITLFELAHVHMNEMCQNVIELSCTASARKFFFNAERIGYLKYGLNSVMRLKSRHSYIMFLYLERNRQLHCDWEEDVERLKKMLGCDCNETYESFKKFNEKILKPVRKEITEKTACWYVYEKVLERRRVKRIHFVLQEIDGFIGIDNESISLLGGMIKSDIIDQVFEDQKEVESFRDPDSDKFLPISEAYVIPDYMEPLKSLELRVSEYKEIDAMLKLFPDTVVWAPKDGDKWDSAYRKYLLLMKRTIERKVVEKAEKGEPIKKPGRYLIKMIKNELEACPAPSEETEKKDKRAVVGESAQRYLNRYSQREYSDEEKLEIERKMLERSLGITIDRGKGEDG